MKLTKLVLTNFRGIDSATFELLPSINLFVGINGSGKSSILDAAVIALSWLVNRIQREGTSGRPITRQSIKNDEEHASIELEVSFEDVRADWLISRTIQFARLKQKSELGNVSELAASVVQRYHEDGTLPVIAYYPVNRIVGSVSPDIPGRDSVSTLSVYDNALGGQTNYQAFFEWFRTQDDILNEKANSRSKWINLNKSWIRRRIERLLKHFDTLATALNIDDQEYKDRIVYRLTQGDSLIYEEPRYMFQELSEIIHFVQYKQPYRDEFNHIIHELDYMLHRMASLSDSRKDDLRELNDYPFSIVWQIIMQIQKMADASHFENRERQLIDFIWDSLTFSVLLSFWWMSDRGKKRIEALLNGFRSSVGRRSYDSQKTDQFMMELEAAVRSDLEQINHAQRNQGRELYFVTRCIENFIEGYSNLRVTRIPRPQLLVDKFGITISLDQLSDGEKNLIAMVGDIARRLAIANQNNDNPLAGAGIILIDEIDLHLHPSWQRLMIPQLQASFPNCQFIITTHSPQVISHTLPESVFMLYWEPRGKFAFAKAHESYGKNTDRILEDLLDVDARPIEIKENLDNLYLTIQEGRIQEARKQIEAIERQIGADPELTRARSLIKRKEIINK